MRREAPPIGIDPEFDKIVQQLVSSIGSSDRNGAWFSSVLELMKTASLTEAEAIREITARSLKATGRTFPVEEGTIYETAAPVDQNAPRVLTVPPIPTEPYWYEDPDESAFIEHHIMARRALGSFVSGGVMIVGPAGSGKTSGVGQLIDRMNRERGLDLHLLTMDCAVITDPQKWFGRREIDKDGTRYEKSTFVTGVESGWVLLLDDIRRLHPTIHNPIMNWLAGDETVLLSDLNVEIKRHPETVFIATANEGSQFSGNHRMDYAMEERWPYRIERDFPADPLEEIRIITSRAVGCSDNDAGILVAIARKTRGLHLTGDLRVPISTRTLVHAGVLVASGYTVREALIYTAVGLYDGNADGSVGAQSEREKVKQIIDGKRA